MPLTRWLIRDGLYLECGDFVDDNGITVFQSELEIPFVRNRFSNPLGRLLGPDGSTVKQIRKDTQTEIIVHDDLMKASKQSGEVTIRGKGDPVTAENQLRRACEIIQKIINEENPDTAKMSDFQLFHRHQANEIINWDPSTFKSYYGPGTEFAEPTTPSSQDSEPMPSPDGLRTAGFPLQPVFHHPFAGYAPTRLAQTLDPWAGLSAFPRRPADPFALSAPSYPGMGFPIATAGLIHTFPVPMLAIRETGLNHRPDIASGRVNLNADLPFTIQRAASSLMAGIPQCVCNCDICKQAYLGQL